MFGFSAFAALPFNAVYQAAPAPPAEIPLGGHFGFDEKKRNQQWDADQRAEDQRKLKLREALFGLPPAEREELTSAPTQAIEVAARDPIDYAAMMEKVRQLEFKIRLRRDEEEITQLLEML
jgi:Spy/CpxP family protein refolding chaperone